MKKEEFLSDLINDLKDVDIENKVFSKKISEYAISQIIDIFSDSITNNEDVLIDHLQRLIGHAAFLEKQKYGYKEFNYSSDIIDSYDYLKQNYKEKLKFEL